MNPVHYDEKRGSWVAVFRDCIVAGYETREQAESAPDPGDSDPPEPATVLP